MATSNKTQAAQVYFPVDVYFQIKYVAKKADKPLATWIREVVMKELNKTSKKRKKFSDFPTFSGGGGDGCQDIDKIVYGL